MLNGPLMQLAPVFTLPCLPKVGYGMLRRRLLVEPASVSGCIVGVAHDVLSKKHRCSGRCDDEVMSAFYRQMLQAWIV